MTIAKLMLAGVVGANMIAGLLPDIHGLGTHWGIVATCAALLALAEAGEWAWSRRTQGARP